MASGPGPDDTAVPALVERGELEVIGRMPWSSNATYLCEVSCGGEVMRAIYKPRRGERPLWDFEPGLHGLDVSGLAGVNPLQDSRLCSVPLQRSPAIMVRCRFANSVRIWG